RIRMQEELGLERENEIYRGISQETVEIDGKKQKVDVVTPNGFSPYARCFDATSPHWVKDAEMNRYFLTCQLNYFNHRLQAYGHVFLNEVYDALGFDRTTAGQVVGWVRDPDDGDGHIDFGIF